MSVQEGSSPLTRGKRRLRRKAPKLLGLIPAHAGKTVSQKLKQMRFWAHPRSRGENTRPRRAVPIHVGSSPLTRGKRAWDWCEDGDAGLIPAHAGKTRDSRAMWPGPRAHPRSRGENWIAASRSWCPRGSSPLTRGKPFSFLFTIATRGLIPAHAGKTYSPIEPPRRERAHPRSRGENLPLTVSLSHSRGSSPLTRGKRCVTGPWVCYTEAHPRSRGENFKHGIEAPLDLGSSPLTRGKHFLTCAFIAQIGQILESLELCASSESYSLRDAYATDAPQDRVRSIGLVPRSSRGASSA